MHPSTCYPERTIGTEGPKGLIDSEHLEEEKATGYTDARAIAGDAHFHRLGWKRLTVVLIVQSIALGTLSIPSAFACLGMVAGVVITVALGVLALYASNIVGLLKLKYPHIPHYADFGRLLLGSPGDWLLSSVFVAQLTLVVGSHCITGKLALAAISDSTTCSLIFSAISAVILFILAIPPSFAEVAVLGYIDFASIMIAVGIAIIATGLQRDEVVALPWSAWPKDNLTLSEAFVAVSNIVFAYAFASAQPSFIVTAAVIARFNSVNSSTQVALLWTFLVFSWIFQFAFSMCCGSLSWVIPAEIFDTKTRSHGVAIGCLVSFAFNTMIGQITDLAISSQGWRYFLLFVICNVTNAIFFWAFLPETKGVPLEEMNRLFKETGWFIPGQRSRHTTELAAQVEEKSGTAHIESSP